MVLDLLEMTMIFSEHKECSALSKQQGVLSKGGEKNCIRMDGSTDLSLLILFLIKQTNKKGEKLKGKLFSIPLFFSSNGANRSSILFPFCKS